MTDALLKSWIDEYISAGIPGISVRVISKGLDVNECGGYFASERPRQMDATARYPISCLVKSLIAALVLQDCVEGRLDLDAPITRYLPELQSPAAGLPDIALRHLLSHTGGFRDPEVETEDDWEKFATLFRLRQQFFTPGVVWSYSHASFIILAEIIIRTHRLPLPNILQNRILDPLSISGDVSELNINDVAQHRVHVRTGALVPYRLPRQSSLLQRTMSDIHLTVDEIARIASYICGFGEAAPLIVREARELLLAPSFDLPTYFYPGPAELMPEQYGLGLGIVGGTYGQNGSKGGSTCTFRFDPARKVLVVVAMNTYNPALRDLLAMRVLSSLSDWRWAPKRHSKTSLQQAGVAGVYRGLMRETGWARVSGAGDLEAEIFGQRLRQRLTVIDGVFELERKPGAVPIGLATLPGSHEPVLMVSASAFRRVEAA